MHARSCSTPAAPTATPAPRASRPPTRSPSRWPTGSGIGAVDVVVCSTGLIGADQRPRACCSPASTTRSPPWSRTAASDAADRDHDHRHGQQAGRRRPRRSGWSDRRDGQGRRHAGPAAGHHAGGAHHRRRRRRRDRRPGAAGRDPGQLRPARLRRLHVHQRHGHAAGQRRLGHHPDRGGLHRGAVAGLHRPRHAAAGRRRGRRPRHRDHRAARRDRGRRRRGRPARSPAARCSRPRCSARTPTGAGCSPPSAPPHAAVRPGRPRRRHERRLGLPQRRRPTRTRPASTWSSARSA